MFGEMFDQTTFGFPGIKDVSVSFTTNSVNDVTGSAGKGFLDVLIFFGPVTVSVDGICLHACFNGDVDED